MFAIHALLGILMGASTAVESANLLTNPDFCPQVPPWTISGDAQPVVKSPIDRKPALRLGPGEANASQRLPMSGSEVVYFGVKLKASSLAVKGEVRVKCYDDSGRLVLEASQAMNPKKVEYVGVYFKTQATTASIVAEVAKSGGAGYLYASGAVLNADDYGKPKRECLIPPADLFCPLWTGARVVDETVLPVGEPGATATCLLLHPATKVDSVTDYTRTKRYVEGKDYVVGGRTITIPTGSSIPRTAPKVVGIGELGWYELRDQYLRVTYETAEAWAGPVPAFQGDRLPRTLRLLQFGKPLSVVAYGDSITHGFNATSVVGIAPYEPTWARMFTGEIARTYNEPSVSLINAALPGATSEWGMQNADAMVASVRPDLVIIAFGMNDFWWISPERFRNNIVGIMNSVRKTSPQAEFILVSSIPFDPLYTHEKAYLENVAGYRRVLAELAGFGTAYVDMGAVGEALLRSKRPSDLMTDPMHPNDYYSRWYAQALAAALVKPDHG